MKTRRFLSGILTVLGVALSVGTIWLVILGLSASPRMLVRPQAACNRAQEMMDAICRGDYETASRFLYGTPSLGSPPETSSPAVDLLWDAFQDSLECEFLGDCYAADSGVAMDVKIRSLDLSSAAEALGNRAQALWQERIETAEDSSKLYDAQNNYRQDLIDQVLLEAARQALEENRQYQEHTLSLHLIPAQGEWWVMPEAGLLEVLSGSIPG